MRETETLRRCMFSWKNSWFNHPPFILWTSHRTKGGGWPFWIYFYAAYLRINSPQKVTSPPFSHPCTPSPHGTKTPVSHELIRVSRSMECFLLYVSMLAELPHLVVIHDKLTWSSHFFTPFNSISSHWMVLLSFHMIALRQIMGPLDIV